MRPPGEIRTVILSTVRAAGPMTLRDIAERSQVGYEAARRTLDNAVRGDALQIVGHEKRAHCDKWVALYDVPREASLVRAIGSGFTVLGSVLSRWR